MEGSWILDALGYDSHPQLAGWLLYGIIVTLTVVVYNLGFAQKLPILKTIFIYIMLLFGCLILQIFAVFGLPVVESLAIAALILIVYKIRLHNERSTEAGE
ncbi:hypothetical protein CIB95_02425 [Lottiidibacillus patelloidae]|uniref:YlaH-like protein n=1 Tax=Lottiidibacillus patelloidae TaxID=2670334 RepID=A0A263BXH7_9BACI|nr:YlaH-like family protein [Lottiidibacillus patelloidae]OZM58443.1 hypothetical protein CIB95_02425 [Lottiidibacillus patelloidae]